MCCGTWIGQRTNLMDSVKQGKADYHFIEIMACRGCLGGGGQPIPQPTKSDKEG